MSRQLNPDEAEILRSFDAGEWNPAKDRDETLKRHQRIARATFEQSQAFEVQLSPGDLEALKKRALKEGTPFQALVSGILHKYISGRLREQPV